MATKKRSKSTTINNNLGILGQMPGNSYKGVCSPLGIWREDDPSLHPLCSNEPCSSPILTGDSYYIIPNTNLVLCIPCSSIS